MKPCLWLLSPHSRHLFNLLLPREPGEAETAFTKAGLRPVLPIQGVQSPSVGEGKGQVGLGVEGVVLQVPGRHLPRPFPLP